MAANVTAPAERPAPPAGLHLAILIATGLILWALTCGLWDLQGPDEGRYVQVAKELLARGNWLVLSVGGDLYDEKLPPPFWVLATLLRVTGGEPSAWLLRLPAVFAAIATVAMTYLIGRGLYGWRAGWIAAWIAMATPLVLSHTAAARLDMIFTAFTTLSLAAYFCAARERPLPWPCAGLMCVALVCAIFYKGPVALVFIVSILAVDARLEHSWAPFVRARLLWVLLALGLVFIGWYHFQNRAAGESLSSMQVKEQIFDRFFRGDHPQPIWYYGPRLLTEFFPWSLLLIAIAVDFWRRRGVPAPVRPLVAWILIPLLLFSLASGKRQTYMLPIVPALALLVGWWLAPRLAKSRSPKWLRPWAVGILTLAGAAIPAFYSLTRLIPKLSAATHIDPSAATLAISCAIGMAIIVAAFGLLGRSADPSRVFAAVTAAMLLFGLSNYTCLEPARNPYYSTRAFAARIDHEMRTRGLRTLGGVDEAAKAEYYIYGHYPAKRFQEDALRGKIPMPGPITDMLVVDENDLEHLAPILAGKNYRPLFAQTVAGDSLRVYVK